MPDGVVQWFDVATGEGRIVRGGRRYAIRAGELEPAARRPGARVHFDVEGERAVNALLRRGTRTSPHQHWHGAGPAPTSTAVLDRARPGTPADEEETGPAGHEPLAVETVARGDIGPAVLARARERIAKVSRLVGAPVLFAEVKLALEADPARDRPAIAEAMVDVGGEPVRAQVAAHTMEEAVDLLELRLRDKLDHRSERLESLRRLGAPAEAGEWRHGTPPTQRPEYFDRPVGDRQVVRHKTFPADELTPDEAAFDLEMLDYDFLLYVDLASGDDTVMARDPEGGYTVSRMRGGAESLYPAAVPLSGRPAPAPVLSLDEARERLDAGGEPFVFYAERATGRGHVLYRRYDGHYGLIEPAVESA